jgi:hypothetical protein
MRKIFILALVFGLFLGAKAYSANTCTWAGNPTTCTAFDSTTFASLQTACDTATQTLASAEQTLCGDVKYYDTSTGHCSSNTPSALSEGGIWGDFKSNCFSDTGSNQKSPCLCLDSKGQNFYFVYSNLLDPVPIGSCNKIECFKDTGVDDLSKVCSKNCSTTLTYARVETYGSGNRIAADILTGGLTAIDTSLTQRPHADNTSTCRNDCNQYWPIHDSIPALQASIVSAQAALNAMCQPPCAVGDNACLCTTGGGTWMNNNCICTGLTGSALNQCTCTQSGGIWINGQCDTTGQGALPSTYGNDNTLATSSGSAVGNASTASSDQTGLSNAGTSTTAGLSGKALTAGTNAGAGVGTASDKSSYLQLKDDFGASSISSSQKFATSGKALYGLPENKKASSTKKSTSQGVAPSNSDIFVMVTSTYADQYEKGYIEAPSDGPKPPSKVEKLGTKPTTY